MRALKDMLYQQVARVANALASPKRLELLELLCQGEKSVETLAGQADVSVKLASAHLRALRVARLVDTRREGKYVFYRIPDPMIAALWVTLRELAEERLVELRMALSAAMDHANDLQGMDRKSILSRARSGEILVLDVRPPDEFDAAHLPHALSMPLSELKKRLAEIPKDVPVVAYCRGPFCFMAKDAVGLLRAHGYHAFHLTDGVAEWRAHGLALER